MKGEQEPIRFSMLQGIAFEISGDFEYDAREAQVMAQTYLPGAGPFSETDSPFTVEYLESEARKLELAASKARIFDNWNGRISLDLWHFVYGLLRLEYLKKDLFPVHAACAGKEDYVLLAGHSGDGKSTVLLKLVNDYGWSVFSGNKTVVSFDGGLRAVAGTRTMSLKESTKTHFPNLAAKAVQYLNRTAFLLDDKHYANKPSVEVKSIFLVKLNDGVSETETIELPSSMHVLYPYFMDSVNADVIMCGGNEVLSGCPPTGSQQKLARELSLKLPPIKVVKIAGSLDFVTRTVAEG